MTTIKTVDIIIPVYKPSEEFRGLLRMLCAQTVKPGCIIIIETVEDDEYPNAGKTGGLIEAFIREHTDIAFEYRRIPKQSFDHAGTRRMAVELSKADAFICMTDDALPKDEYLIENLLSGFEDENVVMVYARQLARESASSEEKITREFNYSENSVTKSIKDLPKLGIKTFFASNVCCAYRRDAYDFAGGFPEYAVFNEDMITARKMIDLGYRIRYEATALVYHSHKYSGAEQFHRNFDLGMSQAMNEEIFGDVKSESEGKKLVLKTIRTMCDNGDGIFIPAYIYRTAMRYLGYKLGKNYKKLPVDMVKAFALNKTFVKKHLEDNK